MSLSVAAATENSFSPSGIFRKTVAGIVCGFLAIVNAIGCGNLLLSGGMRSFVPLAIGMMLFSTAVVAAVAALTSSIRGVIACGQDIPIVALAVVASAITADMAGRATDTQTFATIVAVVILSTVTMGLTFMVLGQFGLGRLIRFVPYPVVGGFLAGTGWLILVGGLSVVAGESLTLSSLGVVATPAVALKLGLGIAFIAVLAFVRSRSEGDFVLPATIVAAIVLFNAVVLVAGISSEVLHDTGWLAPIPHGEWLWPPVAWSELMTADWTAVLGQASAIAAVAIVTTMALLMNITGIEIDSRRDVDLNRELRSVGLQNILAGAGGGPPGYPSIAITLLSLRIAGPSRSVGLIAAALILAALLFGEATLDIMPTPVFGSLLAWLGVSLLIQWLILSYWRLSLWEYLVIVLIVVVVAGVGFTSGVLVGLVAAIVLFVIEYSRADIVRHVMRGSDYQSNADASEERREALLRHGDAILIFRLQGYLFFGTADRLRERVLDEVGAGKGAPARFVVIDFHRVSGLDSSAAVSFIRLAQIAARDGFVLVLTGVADRLRETLRRGKLESDDEAPVHFHPDIERGLAWCENALLREAAPDIPGQGSYGLPALLARIMKDDAAIDRLTPYFERVEVAPGTFLIEQGSPSDDVYFVESGRAAVAMEGTAGDALRLAGIGPGAIVGEVAFYLGTTRTASVVAEEPTAAWRFTRAALGRLQDEHPDLASRFHAGLAAMLAARLTRTNRLVRFLAD